MTIPTNATTRSEKFEDFISSVNELTRAVTNFNLRWNANAVEKLAPFSKDEKKRAEHAAAALEQALDA